jgi:hypothetical protein
MFTAVFIGQLAESVLLGEAGVLGVQTIPVA